MENYMEDWKRKREEKRNEERKRLLAYNDYEALKLSHPDQYQRMRYLREIEAAEWLAEVRRKLPVSEPMKKRYAKQKTTVVFNQD
jgi:hypothetical protein